MATHRLPHDRNRSGTRLADAEIYDRLDRLGFDPAGHDWLVLQGELVDYGYSVLVSTLTSPGQAVRMAREQGGGVGVRGLGKLPRDLWLDEDDARDVAVDVVTRAVRRFHRTLEERRWSPTGGASLTTFFFGRCLMELPDAYVRWQRRQGAPTVPVEGDGDEAVPGRRSPCGADPADAATAVVLAEQALRALPTDVQAMFGLRIAGYTDAEIAAMSARAGGRFDTEAKVRSALSRARRKARRNITAAMEREVSR